MDESDDVEWMRDVVVDLLRTTTQVPLGQTEIQPGDPTITAAMSDAVLPRIKELRPTELLQHPAGDIAARFGPSGESGLLLQTYIVSQHSNLMEADKSGSVVGDDNGLMGAHVLGQGASQPKGALAATLTALRSLPEDLAQPVWLTVNTEGKSSHDGSRRILDDLGVTAAAGVLAVGTDLRVSLGNRGRVDVRVTVQGESSHSSQPWLGSNPIEDAADLIRCLRTTPLPEEHEQLGPVSATPYQFACRPISPHTIPSDVQVMVDRRLLPGESPELAVDGLRSHVAGMLPTAQTVIETGEVMLPAVVPDDSPIVSVLCEALRSIDRPGEQTYWSPNTFDAGYACSKDIPTVMFGPGQRKFAGSGLLGDDSVSISDMWAAVEVLRYAIGAWCRR